MISTGMCEPVGYPVVGASLKEGRSHDTVPCIEAGVRAQSLGRTEAAQAATQVDCFINSSHVQGSRWVEKQERFRRALVAQMDPAV